MKYFFFLILNSIELQNNPWQLKHPVSKKIKNVLAKRDLTFMISKLRLGAQSSYVVKYFEGSKAVKTMSMRN